MELLENDYILGYWFASDKKDNCWYKIIIKRENKWLGQYTFRYNKSEEHDDPHSGKDEKNIYNFYADGNEKECEMIEKANSVWTVIKLRFNDYSDMFLVQGDRQKFLDMAKEKDYLHLKEEKINKH
jgi:hypothetical protein